MAKQKTKKTKVAKPRSSYVATGAIEPPSNSNEELGSSVGTHVFPLVPELTSRHAKLKTFNQMARGDVTSSVSLRVTKAPILGASFYFEPASDDEQGRDQAQFAEDNITKLVSTPWLPLLSKILRMYQDGFSILEDVWKLGEWRPDRPNANTKNYTILKKLAYRPSTTIQAIIRDSNGGPQTIRHTAVDGDGKSKTVEIPIEKAAIFYIGDSDDFFGISMLESAYEHWFYKKHLYKIDAIQKERHGLGVPRGTLPPGYNDDDIKFLKKLLANIRVNENSYIIQKPGWEIDFAKPEGNMINALESASAHDTLILLNVMAQFMILGLESAGSGGGRSTSAASLDIFYKSLWHIANLICDVFNMYIVPKLIQYNFETDKFPKMKVRALGQSRDLQQIAAALGNVFKNQIITPDIETENWTRTNIFDMPRKTGEKQTPIKSTTPLQPSGGGNGMNGNSNAAPTQP